ncbi:MAG: hypothetical protein ACRDAJ_00975, partial [Serratia fonticola]
CCHSDKDTVMRMEHECFSPLAVVPRYSGAGCLLLLFFCPTVWAAPENTRPLIQQQQQRQKALEHQLLPPTPDVRLSQPSAPEGQRIFFSLSEDQGLHYCRST